jgi:AcrR family transcriptional regulator
MVQRGNRIMDVTADLILRWGYQKVTIEDVARRAGIGKGTIYLHWRSREALFRATLLRETLDVFGSLVDRMRADPVTCLPHRLYSELFAENMRQPLLVALLTKDTEVLGRLVAQDADDPTDREEDVAAYREYVLTLRDAGLVRTDLSPDQQLYLMQVFSGGAPLMQPYLAPSTDIPLPDKESALAHALREAFEPAGPIDRVALAEVAPQVIALFSKLIDRFRDAIHRRPVPTARE